MEEKREHIIKVAMKLFATNGFHATPTSLIVKEAGIAKGTLFNYFNTKEELINEIYLYCKKSMSHYTALGLKECKTIKSKTQKVFENFIFWGVNNPFGHKFLKTFHNSPFINKITIEEAHKGFEEVQKLIDDGISQEIIKHTNRQALEMILGALIFSCTDYILTLDESQDNQAVIEDLFCYIWDCIRS